MKDLKYLSAFSVPLLTYFSLQMQGIWAWSTVTFVFGLIPFLEMWLPKNEKPYTLDEIKERKKNKLFDFLLYANVPIVYFTLYFFYVNILDSIEDVFTLTGWVFSVGIVLGSNGINVAHELGHRNTFHETLLAKILLLPCFYLHFYIEHNKGHHRYVSTPLDPATARINESVYHFWYRSVKDSYLSAWGIQLKELKTKRKAFFSSSNQMFLFQLLQVSYLLIIFYISQSFFITGLFLFAGVIGFLLLETINYIEHYGLERKQIGPNRWEKVQPWHSWNANYEVGRILLYELTRHSDHHYQAQKPYQLLEHHPNSPQLPLGYPGSMLLSLIPSIWFKVINPRIPSKG